MTAGCGKFKPSCKMEEKEPYQDVKFYVLVIVICSLVVAALLLLLVSI